MEDMERTLEILACIKQIGVDLSIDDFGTGYSSLSYLKQFPINTLKIDQSFVRNLDTDPDSLPIVKAIIALAKSLNLKVIAEGVETEEHLNILKAHDCEHIQGYFISRPVPPDDFERFLADSRQTPSQNDAQEKTTLSAV